MAVQQFTVQMAGSSDTESKQLLSEAQDAG